MKWCGRMFREQVNTLLTWFEQWNDCEQTVALYSLIKRLSPTNARFLHVALDHSLGECAELQPQEVQANNPAFVTGLLSEAKEVALNQLLLHLPLLRPGNTEAKNVYVTCIHKILSYSVETGVHIEEARQLLCYSLIHPAISCEDRKSLTQWLRHIEERIKNGYSPHHSWCSQQYSRAESNLVSSSRTSGVDCSSIVSSNRSSSGECTLITNGHFLAHGCSSVPTVASHHNISAYTSCSHPRVRRSNSLTPPVNITQSSEVWGSQDDLSGRHKPRSFSLSSEHAPPLSPQNSLASSGSGGSEGQLDLGFVDASGMRDVPAWLKSLRLHKYVSLFHQLSYEEMMNLSEEWLMAQGVTKGARHKIILSIRKLKERYNTLCQLEKDVCDGGNLASALEELKVVLLSPIKPTAPNQERDETEGCSKPTSERDISEPEDIPAQFTKVMGKVCTQLLVSNHAEEDAVCLFVWLLDRCLQHEAFSPQQKRRLASWKLQVQDVWSSLPSHRGADQRHSKNRWQHHSQFFSTSPHNASFPRNQPRFLPQSYRGSKMGPVIQNQQRNSLSVCSSTSIAGASFMAKRPSLQDQLPESLDIHNNVHRTRSAPLKPGILGIVSKCEAIENQGSSEPEINSRLESLCLSMTEHALGGCNEV